MCLIQALIVSFLVLVFAGPGPAAVAFAVLAVLGLLIMKSEADEDERLRRLRVSRRPLSEFEQALWIAKEAGAIVATQRDDTFHIVDQWAYDRLPADVRMVLELRGRQQERKQPMYRQQAYRGSTYKEKPKNKNKVVW